MFDHLDDPRPPVPSSTLAEGLRAEGLHRRRRRVRAAGGAVLGVALLAGGLLRPWESSDVDVEVGPSATSSTAPDPTTTAPDSTPTSEAPPSGTFPPGTFAAITPDGRVVLADLQTGAIVEELDQLDGTVGYDVARAPDGSAVYVAASSTGLWRYAPGAAPARIGSAFTVAVSPDGARLAVVSDGAEDFGTIRILASATGEVLQEISVPDFTGDADRAAWTAEWELSGRLLVNANLPEAPSEVFVLELDGEVHRLGPPPGGAAGTGWYLGGPAGDGEAWVLESCCALDANSFQGDRSLLRIDTRTGAVLARQAIDPAVPDLVLDAGPAGEGFLLLSPAYEGNEAGGMIVGGPDGSLDPKAWPAFTAVDW